VRPHLQSGKLTVLSGGLEFALSAYVVYPRDAAPDVVGPALGVIRQARRWKAALLSEPPPHVSSLD
jgi:hypothetical protein